ncbi:hypothetical protein LLH00_12795 [bacterium]|nr:hypothetical protein [bacterium]
MYRYLGCLLLGLALLFVSCKDDSDQSLAPLAEESMSLSGAKLTDAEREAIIKASPDYGKWVYHENLGAYIEFRKQHRLDEAMGDGIVDKMFDQAEKQGREFWGQARGITQADYEKLKAKSDDWLAAAYDKGEISREEKEKYAGEIDLMLKNYLNLPNKAKRYSSARLASENPHPVDGARITLTAQADIATYYGPAVNSTLRLLYTRPTGYTDRRLHDFRTEWSVPTSETAFNRLVGGAIAATNGGCYVPDSSWTPFLTGLYSQSFSGNYGSTGYNDFGTPALNKCFMASSSWSFVASYICNVDLNSQGTETLQTTNIAFIDYPQNGNTFIMGGKCDVLGNAYYNIYDYNRMIDLWADFTQATTYEHWSADKDDDGDLDVADIMQLVYVLTNPSITCHNDVFDPWN